MHALLSCRALSTRRRAWPHGSATGATSSRRSSPVNCRARLSEETSLDSERAELRVAVIRAIQEGFAGSLKVNADGDVYGYLARPDRIASTIDLDALAADYEAWFATAGVVDSELGDEAAEIFEELGWAIDDLRERCYSDYLHSLGEERYRAGGRVRGAVVDGIVVGDDPGQTCL